MSNPLTPAQYEERNKKIVQLYVRDNFTHLQIARHFKMSRARVGQILLGRGIGFYQRGDKAQQRAEELRYLPQTYSAP